MAPTHPCPCCGAAIAGDPIEAVARMVPPTGATILRILADRAGNYVQTDTIVSRVWRGYREPDSAVSVVRVSISNMRPKVRAAGYEIQGLQGRGYRLVATNQSERITA